MSYDTTKLVTLGALESLAARIKSELGDIDLSGLDLSEYATQSYVLEQIALAGDIDLSAWTTTLSGYADAAAASATEAAESAAEAAASATEAASSATEAASSATAAATSETNAASSATAAASSATEAASAVASVSETVEAALTAAKESGEFDGADGADGATGADGKSAYETAVEGGYTGTEEEFASALASMATLLNGEEVEW